MFFLQSPLTRRPEVSKHEMTQVLASSLINLDICLYGGKTLFSMFFFNIRMDVAICNLNMQGFPFHPLVVILAVQKQSACCLILHTGICYILICHNHEHICL